MPTLLQDVKYALRLLRRSPGFTATALLTLAIVIGANTAIFSAVRGILLAPLPYRDPDRLVRVFEESPTTPHFPMAPADFRDYRAELQTFEALAAYFRADLQLGDAQRPEHLRGMQVSSGFFSLLGYKPALGREFEPDDEVEGRNDVVMLSDSLWKRRFDGDPGVVGRSIRLSGRMFRVVGIVPDGVQHVGGTYRTYGHGETIDVWSVLAVPREEHPRYRYSHFYNVVGRVRPGVSPAQLNEDLRLTGASVATRYPTPNSPWKAVAVPLKQEIVGSTESTLVVLAGAATMVLLLACVNVAGLLLGRAASRSREIGVRFAVGATQGRVVRQLLVESLVLAVGGGIAGVALAHGAVAALARYGPADIPRLSMIGVDGEVLAYALAATVASALLFGLTPGLRLARASVGDTLKESGRTVAGVPNRRLQRLLVSVQVALAFLLVVAAGLLLRSFVSMINANPGFDAQGVITASIELPSARYDRSASTEFFRRASERVRALPGIEAVAFSSDLPWSGYDENTGFAIVGRRFPNEEGPEARYHFLTAGYTQATGTRLVAGRDLTSSDVEEAPLVVLLNESAARRYWSSPEAAVGARLNVRGAERTVVGVIGDVKDMPWQTRAAPALYFPQPQVRSPLQMFLIARASIGISATEEPIRRALREIDPELPLTSVRPLEAVASAAIATRRLTLWLVAAFGVTALFLAVVGIYGVMAHGVSQRRQEIGVRQALGATRGDIIRLVFSSSAVMTLAGLIGGVALAAGATPFLASLLYGVSPLDSITFAAVAALLIAAAACATYLPARRATRVSAASALRSD
jgi:predicted permease